MDTVEQTCEKIIDKHRLFYATKSIISKPLVNIDSPTAHVTITQYSFAEYNCYCSLANLMEEGCTCGGK